jgi:hypothetical protein
MKKKLKKYFLLFSAICISLMMISTTTAIPVTNTRHANKKITQNNFIEKKENKYYNALKVSNKNFEKLISCLLFDLNIENTENIDELTSKLGPLTAKEWFNALIIFILCIIFYIPGLIFAIITEYIFWFFVVSAAIAKSIEENGGAPPNPPQPGSLLALIAIIALVPTIICLPLIPFYPIFIVWIILNSEETKNYFKDFRNPIGNFLFFYKNSLKEL